MGKKVITFDDIEIEKEKFYHRKNLIVLVGVDTIKIQVSNENLGIQVSSGGKHKYFIGDKDDSHQIKPLHIMLRKRSTYVKRYYDQIKTLLE